MRRLRAGAVRLAREHATTGRLSVAFGLGAFVGCSPFYGFHFLIGAILGKLARMNQLAILLGEQTGLPFIAPFHVFASVQLGHRITSGTFATLSGYELSVEGASAFWLDWLAGSLLVGSAVGLCGGVLSYLVVRSVRREWGSPNPDRGAERWTGRSRGTALGYAIIFRTVRVLGRRGGYALLWLIVPYFWLFAPGARRASDAFLARVLGPRGWLRRQRETFRHLHSFARSLVDTLVVMAGRKDELPYTSEGHEHILGALALGRGALLLSGHVGSRAVAGQLLADVPLNLVVFENEAEGIRRFIAAHRLKDAPRLITVNDGPAAAIRIAGALRKGEAVALLADRVLDGTPEDQVMTVPFLGAPARFPLGPFLLAAATGAPLLVTFGAKLGPARQHFWASAPLGGEQVPRAARREAAGELLLAYVAELEGFARRYPYQWYNFYDFWGSPEPGSRNDRVSAGSA